VRGPQAGERLVPPGIQVQRLAPVGVVTLSVRIHVWGGVVAAAGAVAQQHLAVLRGTDINTHMHTVVGKNMRK
jgi:hypothetical protein